MSKPRFVLTLLLFLVVLNAVSVVFFSQKRSYSQSELASKKAWVRLVQLPDLALSTAAGFIRHRTLAYPNQVFYAGPEVRDYFPSAFVYRPAPIPSFDIKNSEVYE